MLPNGSGRVQQRQGQGPAISYPATDRSEEDSPGSAPFLVPSRDAGHFGIIGPAINFGLVQTDTKTLKPQS